MQIPPRFGLIDTSDDRWLKFEAKIRQLNQDSPIGTTYKFFILTRHGQGYRTDSFFKKFSNKRNRVNYFIDNVAESKYGTLAWDESVQIDVFCLYYLKKFNLIDIGPKLTEMENYPGVVRFSLLFIIFLNLTV